MEWDRGCHVRRRRPRSGAGRSSGWIGPRRRQPIAATQLRGV